MKKYYLSDGKKRFGPVSFDDLKNYRINNNTLVWYQGLEKWKLAKNIPKLIPLIHKFSDHDYLIILNGKLEGPFSFNEFLNKDIKPETLVWTEFSRQWKPAKEIKRTSNNTKSNAFNVLKNKLKANSKHFTIALIVFISLLVITSIFITIKYYSSDKTTSTPKAVLSGDFSKSEIVSLLQNYYEAQKNKNLKKYKSFYSFPIEKYYNVSNLNEKEFEKRAKESFELTSTISNKPNFNKLSINYINDSIYKISYQLKYQYTIKDKFPELQNYKINMKLDKKGKIKYIMSYKIQPKKGSK